MIWKKDVIKTIPNFYWDADKYGSWIHVNYGRERFYPTNRDILVASSDKKVVMMEEQWYKPISINTVPVVGVNFQSGSNISPDASKVAPIADVVKTFAAISK